MNTWNIDVKDKTTTASPTQHTHNDEPVPFTVCVCLSDVRNTEADVGLGRINMQLSTPPSFVSTKAHRMTIMPSPNYKVFQHSINCQHIREYAGGTKDPSVPLTLAINEYRPLNNLGGEAGSITIIATHANGFPKVTFLTVINLPYTYFCLARKYMSRYGKN
jgi:hypothetical protein